MVHTRLYRRKHRRNTRELGIEVTCISRITNLRLEWWRHTFVIDIVPVDVSEEGVAHNLLRISRATAQAELGFSGEELLQYRY